MMQHQDHGLLMLVSHQVYIPASIALQSEMFLPCRTMSHARVTAQGNMLRITVSAHRTRRGAG
jgi:hypothetical protein